MCDFKASVFGSVGARSWGLEYSCGFGMGVTEPLSIDHRQPLKRSLAHSLHRSVSDEPPPRNITASKTKYIMQDHSIVLITHSPISGVRQCKSFHISTR